MNSLSLGLKPFPLLALVLVVGVAAGAVRARGRRRRLPVLPVTPGTPSARAWFLVTAEGVHVDDAMRADAEAYASLHGLDVLDLIPADLPVTAALDVLAHQDPRRTRTDPLAHTRGACHALLVDSGTASRADVTQLTGLSRADMAALTRRIGLYAPTTTDAVVVPRLAALKPDPGAHKAYLRAVGSPVTPRLVGQVLGAATYAGAISATPAWGLVAVGVLWLQPLAVFAGAPRDAATGGLRPADLALESALRPLLTVVRWVRAVFGPAPEPTRTRAELDRARAQYALELADGTERFQEARRETCPWCESRRLRVRVRTRDLLQGKPGVFTLDRCQDCGHVFQNPRLSLTGLDFYYRDFYDGVGAGAAEGLFATMGRTYRARARMLRGHDEPSTWLDVGTGHAHMCLVARTMWPSTVFDGLDMGAGVAEAARRGWIRTAHVGQFTELADTLPDAYDVVSMHHYLEHTRDPAAELDAAVKVLRPGGHLLIELPDPQSWWFSLMRRRWWPLFQPQHQHLMPMGNLRDALAVRGFTVVTAQRGPAHTGGDFAGFVSQLVTALGPDPTMPWVTSGPTPVRRVRRFVVVLAAIPCYLVAGLLDAAAGLTARAGRNARLSNAYRVLARKDPG